MNVVDLPLNGVASRWGWRRAAAQNRQEVLRQLAREQVQSGLSPPHNPQGEAVNEECYLILGQKRDKVWAGRMIMRSEGTPTSVSFDWAQVLVREETFGDVLGFYHTHPSSAPLPSWRDVRTMKAWATCFGKPLLCAIQSGELLAGYLFEPNGQCKPVARIKRLKHNILIAVE